MVAEQHVPDSFSFVVFAHGPHNEYLVVYMAVCITSGVVIGAVGPGGVMLAPALLLLDVPVAIVGPAVVTSFIFGGITTLVTQRRYFSGRRSWLLLTSAVPGAVGGALLFPLLPPIAVSIFIAFISITCGVNISLKTAWPWLPGALRIGRPHRSGVRRDHASATRGCSDAQETPTREGTSGSEPPTPEAPRREVPRRPISSSTSRDGLISIPSSTSRDGLISIPSCNSCDGLLPSVSPEPSPSPLAPRDGPERTSPDEEAPTAAHGRAGSSRRAQGDQSGRMRLGGSVDAETVSVTVTDRGDSPPAARRLATPAPSAADALRVEAIRRHGRGATGRDTDDEYADVLPRLVLPVRGWRSAEPLEVPKAVWRALLGVVIGLLSLLTSTGGPLIALPLLFRFWPRLSPVRALVLAQAFCIPNGISAFVVTAARGEFDVGLCLAIGVSVSVGIPIGTALAKQLRPRLLRLAVGAMLVTVGFSAVTKVVMHAIGTSWR